MADSVNGTPGDNRGNYRKVFKPNLPTSSVSQMQQDTGSNDSVERANAMALGAPQNSRKPPSGVYEPERHNMNPRSGNNTSAY